jgi:hypothetical protein
MKKIFKLKLPEGEKNGAPPLKLPDLLQNPTEMPDSKTPPHE